MFTARSGHIIQREHPSITSCNRTFARGPCRSQHHVRGQHLGCTSNGIAYRCPTCSQPLIDKDRSTLMCENGHTSLRAKEGYVHLHPSGRKAAVNAAGDAAEMVSNASVLSTPYRRRTELVESACIERLPCRSGEVQERFNIGPQYSFPCQVKARRRFLDAGHYDIVADEISSIAAQAAGSSGQVRCLASCLPQDCGSWEILHRSENLALQVIWLCSTKLSHARIYAFSTAACMQFRCLYLMRAVARARTQDE